MKYARRIALLIIFLFLLSFPSQIYAHPGKTDSNGGHYDRNTGSYHYHHGYPAHSHYDMDGDGIVDCPYDFKDRTNHDSNDSISNNSKPVSPKNPKPVSPKNIRPVVPKNTEKVKIVPVWLATTLIIINICLALYIKHLHTKITNVELSRKDETLRATKEKLKVKEEIHTDMASLLNGMTDTYGNNVIEELSGMPSGESLDKKLLPVGPDAGKLQWGSKYTFYSCYNQYHSRSNIYHRPECRYANLGSPVNAYEIKNVLVPCQICYPLMPNTTWVDKYRFYKTLFNKYGVELPNESADKNEPLQTDSDN